MLKLSSYILSFIIVIQSFGFNINSLTQLDELWEHYQEHKIEYGDSLLTFLDLHYGSLQQEHQDEHPEHQELPSQFSLHIQYTCFTVENLNFQPYHVPESIQHNFGYSKSFTSLLETDILQPPRPLA